MPPHLKKSINQAHLENGTYEQSVSHLEKGLELNGLEAPVEMQINTVTQQATQQNSGKPKPTCHHCKKPGHYRNQCRQLKRNKDHSRKNTNSADNNNGGNQTNFNSNNRKLSNNINENNPENQKDRRPRPVDPPCQTCRKTNYFTEKCYLGANAENKQPPRTDNRKTGRTTPSPTKRCPRQIRWERPSCSQNFKLETPRPHSGISFDRPEIIEIPKLPPIPEVVWQQTWETSTNQCNLNNNNNDSTSKSTVASQTSPPKGSQPQNYVVSPRNTLQEIKEGTNQYRSLTAPRRVLPISTIQNSM